MEVALLDAERVLPKYKNLRDKVQPIPSPPKHTLLGLLIIYKRDIENPLQHYFTFHSLKKGICYTNNTPRVQDVDLVMPHLLKDNMVWTSIPLAHLEFHTLVDKLAKHGFHHPYMCDETPLGMAIEPSLALCRKRHGSIQYDEQSIKNKINYVLEHQFLPRCNLTAQFSRDAVQFLKNGSKMGHTKNKDNTVSQKEMSGRMYVSKVIQEDGNYVYIIKVDDSSIQHGNEEDVGVMSCNYNFHTHPKEAYERHSVRKAWPSLSDFLGFLKISDNTIFHTVITLEGVYLIYMGPYWSTRARRVKRSFVKQRFHIPHTRDITPRQFAELINNIKYKGHPIFQVIYISWDNIHKPFSLSFPKYEGNCFPIDQNKDIYDMLHS